MNIGPAIIEFDNIASYNSDNYRIFVKDIWGCQCTLITRSVATIIPVAIECIILSFERLGNVTDICVNIYGSVKDASFFFLFFFLRNSEMKFLVYLICFSV